MDKLEITFVSACTYAMSNQNFVENYDRLTGNSLGAVLSSTGLNALVDESTGRKAAEMLKFATFFDEFVWSRLPNEAFTDKTTK